MNLSEVPTTSQGLNKARGFKTSCLVILLTICILCISVFIPYNKARATGAEGIIMAGGSVAPYVALVALMAVAGVCAVDAYQNSDDIESFGHNMYNAWSEKVVSGAESVTSSEIYQWLENAGNGLLNTKSKVFTSFRDFLSSLTGSNIIDYEGAIGNVYYHNEIGYKFNDNIYRSLVNGETLIVRNDNGFTIDGVTNYRAGVAVRGSGDIYLSVYNDGTYIDCVFSSLLPFEYADCYDNISIGSSAWHSTSKQTTLGNSYYYHYRRFALDSYSKYINIPFSSFTTSDYTFYNLFKSYSSYIRQYIIQGYLQLFNDFENLTDNDDVIIKNPSITAGDVYANNDVIGLGAEWGLINGADVGIVDGVLTYPDVIALEWAKILELLGQLNDVIAGNLTGIGLGEKIGVIPVDIPEGYTIADEPADSIPVSETKTEIPSGVEDIPENTKPYTFPDLSAFFPFCIPFDLIAFIGCLSAEPETPEFTLGIPLPNSDELYYFTVDLHKFDGLARIARDFECLVFIFALIVITRNRMIKG